MIKVPDAALAGAPARAAYAAFSEPRTEGVATSRRREWLLAGIVFGGSLLFRFLILEFTNDHFRVMVQGRQALVHGEAPFRDFADPGIFLQIYASAAAQAVLGYNLLGEALLSLSVLSLGAALTFFLAARAARSAAIGLVVALFAVALLPRPYQYHVVLLPVLGLLMCWRYADRPTAGRLVTLGLVTALAFLFRHDQGIYLLLAAATTLIVTHWRDGRRPLARRLGLYGAVVAIALAPFFLFLQANGGVVEYFRSAAEYVRSEAGRGRLSPPSFRIDLSAPLLAVGEPPPPLAAPIEVQWSERVTPDVRTSLEERYHLANPRLAERDARGRTWMYDLVDFSPPNVATLVRDRNIVDTNGIDRQAGRVRVAPRESFFVAWQRVVPLLRLRIAPGIVNLGNSIAWLYYILVALPVIALAVLVFGHVRRRSVAEQPRSETAKILATVLLCLVAERALLRNPIGGRLADAAAPTAILAAWLLGRWLAGRRSPMLPPVRLAAGGAERKDAASPRPSSALPPWRALPALGLLAITWISIAHVAELGQRLDRSAISFGPGATLERGAEVLDELRTTPPVELLQAVGIGRLALARYVYECTKPTDRLLVTWFAPEFYFFSGRGFAGKQLFWFTGYNSSEPEQQEAVKSLESYSVPVAISRNDDSFSSNFAQVQGYITRNYRQVREAEFGDNSGDTYTVWVDRRLAPSGTYRPLSLPCYK